MAKQNKRSWAKWASLILLAIAFATIFNRVGGSGSGKADTDSQSAAPALTAEEISAAESAQNARGQRKNSEREGNPSRNQFLKNSEDLSFLEKHLDYALESGFLRDAEIASLYLQKLSHLNVDTIAKLSLADNTSFNHVIINIPTVATRDFEFLKDYFSLIREGEDASRDLLQRIGSDLGSLKTSEIPAFITKFSDLSAEQWGGLAAGLASRLRRETGPVERMDVIRQVFEEEHHPKIYERLGPLVVETLGVEDSIDWLVANHNREVIEGADREFMRTVAKTQEYELAQSFVQTLLDDDQTARAQFAIEAFLPTYAARGSDDALQWIQSLDENLVTTQMRTTVFAVQFRENPGKAEAFVNSQTNPKLRKFYTRLLELRKKSNRRE